MPRGGSRRGAGRRPRLPPPPPAVNAEPISTPDDLPWPAIRAAAENGAEEAEIIQGLGIAEGALADAATLAKFRDEMTRGRARYKLALRAAIRRRGERTLKAAGSVNALGLQARNILDWDKQLPAQETEPDLGTARQRLRDLFERLAAARSEMEGRPITPAELVLLEAQADIDDDQASAAVAQAPQGGPDDAAEASGSWTA